ncbi:hypothetical protein Vadar_001789 [Vaccinium darrowii]|uniref:Uncharacterized protein n=1 Tax=Vaccinium darrowii TaxID=229202 RepID=A0ACB7X6T8_9ERIC|nr:hypothetical protein Vadar_001789 [Vaccinium darrowii]
MKVKFSSTISGFQEEENFHKTYADNKHGRTEIQSINPNDIQNASTSNVEQFLYGYLGTAEDLGKLDSGTKERCIARSKRVIQKISVLWFYRSNLTKSSY